MDTNKIKQIIELFEDSNVSKMELEIEDIKIKLEKPCANVEYVNVPQINVIPQVKQEEENISNYDYVKSPVVGTFYAAPSQGAKPYVEVGSKVKKGDVLCIIEAMKVMNEIKSDCDGVIQEILVSDGAMVEYEQSIFAIGE